MVTVTTIISPTKYLEVSDTICRVTLENPALTPRPKQQVMKALQSHNIALVFDDEILVGWLIAVPYLDFIQEIGMAYLAPSYRNRDISITMVEALINLRQVTIAATYEERLFKLLVNKWQFQASSLSEFSRLTRGKFITSRLSSYQSTKAVLSHVSKTKPIYLIRDMRI